MSIPNKYDGTCNRCGQHVPSAAGEARLTDKGWRVFCVPECEARPVHVRSPVVEQRVGDLAGIMRLFDKARAHLKFPAVELGVPELGGYAVRVNVAGEHAREPGSLTVCDALRADDTGRRAWLGRVTLDGYFQPSRDASADQHLIEAVRRRLVAFAADPAGIAADHGKLTGRCCFCRLPLTDERSTAIGYGQKCAKNFGLPWGARAAEFAGPARRAS